MAKSQPNRMDLNNLVIIDWDVIPITTCNKCASDFYILNPESRRLCKGRRPPPRLRCHCGRVFWTPSSRTNFSSRAALGPQCMTREDYEKFLEGY